MLPWQRHICQLNHQKAKGCVVNLLAAMFGDHRVNGFREKVNETQVPKTVFSHLKTQQIISKTSYKPFKFPSSATELTIP